MFEGTDRSTMEIIDELQSSVNVEGRHFTNALAEARLLRSFARDWPV